MILAALFVQAAMGMAAPWPLKVVLDSVVGNEPAPRWLVIALADTAGSAGRPHIAAAAGVATVMIAVAAGVGYYVASYYTESLGQCIANDLRVRMYHHLQIQSLCYHRSHQVGPILSTMFNDVQTIQNFASGSTLTLVTDSLTITGMIVVMVMLRWDFALIALAATPFLAAFVWRLNRAIKNATKEVRSRQSEMVSLLQQDLQAVDVVQAFGREAYEEHQLRTASLESVAAWVHARRASAALTPVVGLVVAICTGVVLWRGAELVIAGAMTAGALTVFLAYLTKFFQPVRDLATTANAVAQVSVGFDRIHEILDSDHAIPERATPVSAKSFRGAILFDGVSFGYGATAPVLRDLTFRVEAGQMLGIVGPTGSGKSTLASLVGRFYDVDTGSILIDGVDVRDFRLHGLRSQLSFVLQETVLFRGTVRDNIAFGRPQATETEIERAARLANAEEFISRMPMGFDSPISERGLNLSGGQRQRIGIARALIRDSPILILDEPTAALDAESEHLVMQALETLMRGRTVLAITHRLSTIRNADQIIVVDHGTISEHGTHDQLLALDGFYAKLHRLQQD